LLDSIARLVCGVELDLCEVFMDRRKIEQIRFPAPLWRPQWRLWVARWLEARGDRSAAREILLPARCPSYGLTHCQPAIQAFLK
jgi:hypothetical protein